MEETRVESLIEFLYGRSCSLSYACHKLGFSVNDLTESDEDTLYASIFKCEECGTWVDADEEECSPDGRSVCYSCYGNIEDEFEEEDE